MELSKICLIFIKKIDTIVEKQKILLKKMYFCASNVKLFIMFKTSNRRTKKKVVHRNCAYFATIY